MALDAEMFSSGGSARASGLDWSVLLPPKVTTLNYLMSLGAYRYVTKVVLFHSILRYRRCLKCTKQNGTELLQSPE